MTEVAAAQAQVKCQEVFFEKVMVLQAANQKSSTDAAAQAAKDQAKMFEKMTTDREAGTAQLMSLMQQQSQADREREERYLQFCTANNGKEEHLQKANEELEKKLEAAEAQFLEDAAHPEQYETRQTEIFQSFCDEVAKISQPPKTAKPSVAVLGQNGVGKSSLINALVGNQVTPTGIVDTTKIAFKSYESATTEFWDVPGCSEARAYTNLKSIMAIKEMHFILIVYIDRCEHIVKLERMVIACKVPYVVVRNKIDTITEEKAKEKGLSRVQYLKDAYKEEKDLLKGDLVYVSAESMEGLDTLKGVPEKMGVKVNLVV